MLQGRLELVGHCSQIHPLENLNKLTHVCFPPQLLQTPSPMSSQQETEYHSNDFDWEELRKRIEDDSTLGYHFSHFTPQSSTSPSLDSQSWNHFHARHSTGKFFKERRYLFKEFPELASCGEYSKVLEVGCGNGSTALPILR